MIDEIIVAHPTARYGVGYVTKGFRCPKGVPPQFWRIIATVFNPVAAFLTTGGLPQRARAAWAAVVGSPGAALSAVRRAVPLAAGQLALGLPANAVALQQVRAGRLCPALIR